MADYSVFSNPEFSSTEWINSILSDSEDVSVDSTLATVTTKLHIMSQDYSDQLETYMVECMSTMPRLLADISKVEDKLKSTDSEMKKLSSEIANFDQRNVSGVEDLSRLDMMKSNIERCKSTLEEHARWSVLVREAKSQMDSGSNRCQTADRIESMFRSLSILKKLPGHDQRLASCNALKDALLSSLRPTIRKDIANADFLTLKEFLYVFQKLDCGSEFQQEYVASRSSSFLAMWNILPVVDSNAAKWLASNLGRIARLINDEETSVSELFGSVNGRRILTEIAVTTTSPMHVVINQLLSNLNSPSVSFDCYCVVDEFCRRLTKSLEGLGAENLLELVLFTFSGLLEFLPSYLDSENSFMHSQLDHLLSSVVFSSTENNDVNNNNTGDGLDDLLFNVDDDPSEALSLFVDRLNALAASYETPLLSTVERCAKYAGGVKIKLVLRNVMSQLSYLTKQVNAKVIEFGSVCGVQGSTSNTVDGGDISVGIKNIASKIDFQSIDNRIMITNALKIVQAIGIFLKQFQDFENTVKNVLTEMYSQLLKSDDNNNSQGYTYKLINLDVNGASELRSFLSAIAAPASPSTQSNIFAAAVSSSLDRLQLSTCLLLFNLSLNSPQKVIASLDDSWTLSSSTSSIHADNVLPQSVIIQVGEHLLSLVQEFEAFATSDALPDLLFVSTQVSSLAEKSDGWQGLFTACQIKDVSFHGVVTSKESCGQLLLGVGKLLQTSFAQWDESWDNQAQQQIEAVEDNAVLKFVNDWLGSISSAVIALVLVQVMKSKYLTPSGIIQLQTDLSYLSNVINAMGIKPHPLVNHLLKILSFHNDADTLLAALTSVMAQQGNTNRGLHFLLHFDHIIVEKIVAGRGK